MASAPSCSTSEPGAPREAPPSARARQMVSSPPGAVAVAPGHGLQPRTRLAISAARFVQSITPSVFLSLGAVVAAAWSCGAGVSASSRSSVSTITSAPSRASRSESSPAVSSAPIGVERMSSTSPVSIPGSIAKVVMPVSVSPRMIAHWIGAAPRYFGSSEAWMLIEPRAGTSSTALGRIWPNATTTARSAPYAARRSGQPASRRRGGCSTGRPAATAASLMGGDVSR